MQVDISPETQNLLDELVRKGRFQSVSEALDFAVQNLWDEDAWDDPMWVEGASQLVDEARASLAAGRGVVVRGADDARELAEAVIGRARNRRTQRSSIRS